MCFKLMRIRLLPFALCVFLFWGGTLCAAPDRPNIIFILCDDLGYGDVGVLFQNSKAGKKHFTPHLDTMASEGGILTRHYCPAPVCSPSRGSLLLGVHQGHSNVRDNQFDKALADNHTLGSVLQAAGYYTALIGKYGLQGVGETPSEWEAFPTKRGFDTFFGYVRHADGHTHYPAHITDSRKKKELYDQSQNIQNDLAGCYTADLFTARAKKLIVDQTANHPDQPFFIYLALDTPHAALQLPTVEYPSGGGLTGGIQWVGTPGKMINTAEPEKVDSYRHPDYTTAVSNSWTDVEERFATSVRRIDDCVGDLLKTLGDLNIATNTLVVFTSDNGPHDEDYLAEDETRDGSNYSPVSFQPYGEFEGVKRDLWEGGIRMPLLVWWPGVIDAGMTNYTLSQFQDWMPTFTDMAGIPAPARTDGVSLLPVLKGETALQERTVYIEYNRPKQSTPEYPDFIHHGGKLRKQMQAIFMDGYKGVRVDIVSHADNFEIYDPTTDPKEGTNLAGTSDYFNTLQQRMKDRVLQLRRPDAEASRPYDNELVPSVDANVIAGVEYKAYEGVWPWVPMFDTLVSVTNGTTENVSLSVRTRDHDAGLLFSGYVKVPSDGDYTFYLSADTGALLRVHDAIVIEADFAYEGLREVSGTIKLKAGLHPYRLYYRSGAGASPSLSWSWSGPRIAKAPVPNSALMKKTKVR